VTLKHFAHKDQPNNLQLFIYFTKMKDSKKIYVSKEEEKVHYSEASSDIWLMVAGDIKAFCT
jgi:hypothetical protein